MTTMAAIDQVVHHSVTLDLMGMESYRAKEAIAERQATHDLSDANERADFSRSRFLVTRQGPSLI
jgi:hypothetical protein